MIEELGRNKEVGSKQVGEASMLTRGQRSNPSCSWSHAQKMRRRVNRDVVQAALAPRFPIKWPSDSGELLSSQPQQGASD